MATRTTGTYEATTAAGEAVQAFVPHPLPPADPPIVIEGRMAELTRAAEQALSRLEVAGEMVPSIDWFIYAFVRKEAVLSSQIEGTQATLMDLLTYEAKTDAEPPSPDVEEVCNYLDALTYARGQLAEPAGLPMSVRLLNETHRRLMNGVRGQDKQPGKVRRNQNWVGGRRPSEAVHVPPPPHRLDGLLAGLERYFHAESDLPAVVRAGLAHVQFETIHPYLDGNGRIGRLLVTLLFEHWGVLRQPLLYLSLFFKRHRPEYYRRLDAVRTDGDWEGWLRYFLEGVATVADEAVGSARGLFALVAEDRARVVAHPRATLTAVRMFEMLPGRPIVTLPWAVEALGASKPTVGRAIEVLEEAGVLREMTGRQRGRRYGYRAYLKMLRTGTATT